MRIPNDYKSAVLEPPKSWLKSFSKTPPYFTFSIPFLHSSKFQHFDLENEKYIFIADSLIEILEHCKNSTLSRKHQYITNKAIYLKIPSKYRDLFCYYSFKSKSQDAKKILLYLNFDESLIARDLLSKNLELISKENPKSHISVLLNNHKLGHESFEKSALVFVLNQIQKNFKSIDFIDLDFLETTLTLKEYMLITINNFSHPSMDYEQFLCLNKDIQHKNETTQHVDQVNNFHNLSLLIHKENTIQKDYTVDPVFKAEFLKLSKNNKQAYINNLIDKLS